MSKIIGYLRASTDKQDLNHQKLELLEFARKKALSIDECMEITISSRKTSKQRRIDELMGILNQADTLMVTELNRLGRSTSEVIELVNTLIKHDIRVIICKQNWDICQQDINSKVSLTLFSLFGELERDLISLRTKEALASKKRQGQILGKPKGTIQKNKFDQHIEKIKELLAYSLSVPKIARILDYTNHIALNTYIKKKKFEANVANKLRKQIFRTLA